MGKGGNSRDGFNNGEDSMKTIAVAILLLTSYCHDKLLTVSAASTNVWARNIRLIFAGRLGPQLQPLVVRKRAYCVECFVAPDRRRARSWDVCRRSHTWKHRAARGTQSDKPRASAGVGLRLSYCIDFDRAFTNEEPSIRTMPPPYPTLRTIDRIRAWQ